MRGVKRTIQGKLKFKNTYVRGNTVRSILIPRKRFMTIQKEIKSVLENVINKKLQKRICVKYTMQNNNPYVGGRKELVVRRTLSGSGFLLYHEK